MDPEDLEGTILKPEFYFSRAEYILQTENNRCKKEERRREEAALMVIFKRKRENNQLGT